MVNHHDIAEYNRLMDAARQRARELRREAVRGLGFAWRRAPLQASAVAGTRAPRNSSTSSAASAGTASPRQATC